MRRCHGGDAVSAAGAGPCCRWWWEMWSTGTGETLGDTRRLGSRWSLEKASGLRLCLHQHLHLLCLYHHV